MKIAIVNKKGGTGKTTTALNIAYGMRKLKKNVALVDMDPQAHLSQFFRVNGHSTIYDAMKGSTPLKEAFLEVDGKIALAPGDNEMERADIELHNQIGSQTRLDGLIRELEDVIIIDTAPHFGMLTINALMAAEWVIIPVEPSRFSLQGLFALMNELEMAMKASPRLKIMGILVCRYDGRTSVQKEVVEVLREKYGKLVFDTVIRNNTYINRSQTEGVNLFDFMKGRTNGAADYLALCKEILKKGKGK